MNTYDLTRDFEQSNDRLLKFFQEVNDKLNNLENDNWQLKDKVAALQSENYLQNDRILDLEVRLDKLHPPEPKMDYFFDENTVAKPQEDILQPAEGHVYKIH